MGSVPRIRTTEFPRFGLIGFGVGTYTDDDGKLVAVLEMLTGQGSIEYVIDADGAAKMIKGLKAYTDEVKNKALIK